MSSLRQDLRYALRKLAQSPGFTIVAVLLLALGIGPNAATYGMVRAMLETELPLRDARGILWVWSQLGSDEASLGPVSPADFMDWQNQSHVFDGMAAVEFQHNFTLNLEEGLQRAGGNRVSVNLFDVVGEKAAIGRTFLPPDAAPGHEGVAILGHSCWQRSFGGDPNVVGRMIGTSRGPLTVVGVMPSHVDELVGTEIMTPLTFTPDELSDARRGQRSLVRVWARLKPGASLEQAQAEMDLIADRLAAQYPETNEGTGARLTRPNDVARRNALQRGGVLTALLFGASGFVLLIVCANLAHLMLARGAGRRKEIAIQAALGASRFRLIRPLLIESVAISLLGGGMGLVLLLWWRDSIAALVAGTIPDLRGAGQSVEIFAFAAFLSCLTGVVFGLVPALRVSRVDLNQNLKEGRVGVSEVPGTSGLRRWLVVSEAALATALLLGAALTIEALLKLNEVDLGFRLDNLLVMRTEPPTARYGEPERRIALRRLLLERVGTVPGIVSVAEASANPISGSGGSHFLDVAGREPPPPGERRTVEFHAVSPGYFQTMEWPLRRGRHFDERDSEGAPPVAIVTDALVRQFFPGQDPLGQLVTLMPGTGGQAAQAPQVARQIVGVIGDVKSYAPADITVPTIFVPYRQFPVWRMDLVVRTQADPMSMLRVVQATLHDVEPELATYNIRSMEQAYASRIATRRTVSNLLALLAGLAVFLSTVGIYAVIAYSVARRTHEIGVRMAIGAGRGHIVRMVLRQGLGPALIGLPLGVALVLACVYALRTVMPLVAYQYYFGIRSIDPATVVAASLLFVTAALIACYLPALRATRVDPARALRAE